MGMPQLLKSREVANRRKILETMTAVLYEGQLPSADEVDFFLHSLMESVDIQLHRAIQLQPSQKQQQFSEETLVVLGDLRELLGVLIEINRQKNADDKIQCFIHHAVLAKRAAEEHFRRLQMRTGLLGEEGGMRGPLPSVSSLASMARLLVGSNSLRSLVFDLREWVSKMVGGEGTVGGAAPAAMEFSQQQQRQQRLFKQQAPVYGGIRGYPGYEGT
jgi:hypothetical protein